MTATQDRPGPLDPARGTVILSGIVGSTAYGMARPGSDIDRLGIYAAPTTAFHGLTPPAGKTATIARNAPDVVLHEAGKFAALALAGNPTVTELLWLDSYEHTSPLGARLVEMRRQFLSAPRVRDAYLGYADQQFQRLTRKGKFADIPRDRIAKHARHLIRLVEQGTRLWVTGDLRLRVDDPARYFEFGEKVVEDASWAGPIMFRARETFDRCATVLPQEPDRAAVEAWLLDVRHHHYERLS